MAVSVLGDLLAELIFQRPVLLDLFEVDLALLLGTGPRGAGYAVLKALHQSIFLLDKGGMRALTLDILCALKKAQADVSDDASVGDLEARSRMTLAATSYLHGGVAFWCRVARR